MKQKQRMAAITLLLLAIIISACTANNKQNEAGGNAGGAVPDEKVTIKYVSWMSRGEDKEIIADFMRDNPDIIVEDEVLDGSKYVQLIKTRFLTNDAPDVFMFGWAEYAPFQKEGWLMDVTDEPGTQALKQSQDLTNAYSIGGRVYGSMINGGLNAQPVYYNKKIFEQLDIQTPTTIEEFNAAAEKIKASGIDPLIFGQKDTWVVPGVFMIPLIESNTMGKFPAPDDALYDGTLTVEEHLQESFSYLAWLNEQGYIAKASLTLTHPQAAQYFADGKAAMMPQGSWGTAYEAYEGSDPNKFELGAFVFPYTRDELGKVHLGAGSDRNLGISSQTKHAEAAKRLYNYFLEKENLEKYLNSQSLTTLLPGIDFKVDAALETYIGIYADENYVRHFPGKVSFPPIVGEARGNAMQDILTGQTVDAALKKVTDALAKGKESAVIAE